MPGTSRGCVGAAALAKALLSVHAETIRGPRVATATVRPTATRHHDEQQDSESQGVLPQGLAMLQCPQHAEAHPGANAAPLDLGLGQRRWSGRKRHKKLLNSGRMHIRPLSATAADARPLRHGVGMTCVSEAVRVALARDPGQLAVHGTTLTGWIRVR